MWVGRGWRNEIIDKGACYDTFSHLPVSGFRMNRGKSTTQRKFSLSESEPSSLVSGLSLLYCMCKQQCMIPSVWVMCRSCDLQPTFSIAVLYVILGNGVGGM